MTDHAADRPVVVLKPRRAKPFFLRHPWVFSGAIHQTKGDPAKGDIVTVTDADGRFIGHGFYNADSQITVRLFNWDESRTLDDAFWSARIEAAVRLRHDVLRLPERTNAYRVVYSESDGLPGLVVDRYADVLVARLLTAGMAQRRELILNTLQSLLGPRSILEKSDDEMTAHEGIPKTRGVARGESPGDTVETETDGLRFLVDLAAGQKTGFFLDQRENRLAAATYMRGRTVLDAFCYTGAFGITACRLGGAVSVLALDSSEKALDLARRNFELNGLSHPETRTGRADVELRTMKAAGMQFGAVILDPPKFARSRPGVASALRAYRDINLLAMQLLERDGILVTCSCSGHVLEHDFMMGLNDAALEAGVHLQVLERRGQSADHPVIASCPETSYLKCFICRVMRD